MTGSAPVLAPQLQCPGLESLYSGMDAPTANCSVCFQKKRLHLPLIGHTVTNKDSSPAVLSSGTSSKEVHGLVEAKAAAEAVQLASSSDSAVQKEAVDTLGSLVYNHSENQSAAAAEGAVALMVQLAKSSDAAVQMQAVDTLGRLVFHHAENQSAADAAGAVELMCTLLSTSSPVGLVENALVTLNSLAELSSNANKAVSLGAIATLTQLKGRNGVSFDNSIGKLLSTLSQKSEAGKGEKGKKQSKDHASAESKAAAEAQAAKAAAVHPH